MQPEPVIAFTVPHLIPPSINHYWLGTSYTGKDGYSHRGRRQSPEVKAFKMAVKIFAGQRTVIPDDPREIKRAQYRVVIHVYLGEGQRGDADNFNKGCLDGLQAAGVIDTDAKVHTCTVVVHKGDRMNPRTEFIVERLSH